MFHITAVRLTCDRHVIQITLDNGNATVYRTQAIYTSADTIRNIVDELNATTADALLDADVDRLRKDLIGYPNEEDQ